MSQKTLVEKITTGVGSVPSLILHTVIFVIFFLAAILKFISWDIMLLVLTTAVSLEAVYFAIFIQMTINKQARELAEVSEDVEGIQEDIEEISQDVDEIQKDVDEIQEDVGDIQENVEEINADESKEVSHGKQTDALEALAVDVRRLLADIEQIKKEQNRN